MSLSEKVQLLGAGLYADIPDEITIKSIPTASELDYVGGEDFDAVMFDKIFPQAIEEKFNYRNLLEIDYQWVCRCLRLLNYGPYFTTNTIFCDECGKQHYGEYRVNLSTIECKPLPSGFKNHIVISKDEFIDFEGEVVIKLPTEQDMINAEKDKAFQDKKGNHNRQLARICYMIKSIGGNDKLTPLEIKMAIQSKLSSADYMILRTRVNELTDYGLRAGGRTVCPICGNPNAAYVGLVDERFFRPTLGDLREWKNSRSSGTDEDVSGSKTTTSGKHN